MKKWTNSWKASGTSTESTRKSGRRMSKMMALIEALFWAMLGVGMFELGRASQKWMVKRKTGRID